MATAVVLLATGALAGCASQLTAQVTTFHQLPRNPQVGQVNVAGEAARADGELAGRRFVIRPTEAQQSGLEFARYADLVRRALVGKGLEDAGNGPADLGVALSYSVSGSAGVATGPATSGGIGIGSGGGGGVSFGFGLGIGFPIGGGSAQEGASYRRELRVTIDPLDPVDRVGRVDSGRLASSESSSREPATPRLFEGQVISEGPSASLAPVMPAMVNALFDQFPGRNGETRVVRVPLDSAEASN